MRINLSKNIKTDVINNMELNPKGNILATIQRNFSTTSSKFKYSLVLYEAKSLQEISSISIYETYEEITHKIKFSPASNLIAISTKHFMNLYRYSSA